MQFYILFFIAFVGFLISLKLLREHGLKRPMFCPKEFGGGCDIIKHSKYAWFLGLPTALWGALYYLFFILVLALPYILPISKTLALVSNYTEMFAFMVLYPMVGFVFSLRLLLVQRFKLHAFCFWCLLQSIVSTCFFVYSYITWLY